MNATIEQLQEWNSRGLTINQISQLTGYEQSSVRYWYKRSGINYISDIKRWDVSRFLNVNDIDAQYVLGFLAADGYLANHKAVGVYAQINDIEIIYRILSVFDRLDDKQPYYRTPVGCQPQVNLSMSLNPEGMPVNSLSECRSSSMYLMAFTIPLSILL